MSVKISGKEYKMVWERVTEFHEEHKKDKSIITEVLQCTDKIVMMKASVTIGNNMFSGHSYEVIGSNQINNTSALENCETSAIGRALASAGYIGSEFASAAEVANALAKKPKQSKEDLEKVFQDDKWRDEQVGYKSDKKKMLTWKQISEDDLIWIIENWKAKQPFAVKEHELRNKEKEQEVVEKGLEKDEIPFD